MTTFKKTIASALAALTLGGAVLTTSAPAQAGGGGFGGAIAAGVIGGIALGALAASRPAYAAPAYYYGPTCYFRTKRFVDDYGNPYFKRVRFCD